MLAPSWRITCTIPTGVLDTFIRGEPQFCAMPQICPDQSGYQFGELSLRDSVIGPLLQVCRGEIPEDLRSRPEIVAGRRSRPIADTACVEGDPFVLERAAHSLGTGSLRLAEASLKVRNRGDRNCGSRGQDGLRPAQ